MMKKILIGVGVVLGILVVAVVAIPLLVDPNIFKPHIIAKAKEATGRDLVIDGPLKLSIFPTPVVSAEGVRFANMPGGKAPQMVELREVRAGIALLPLLSRRVEVDELRLVEPKIALEVAPDGRANYDFKPADGTVPAPSGGAPGGTATASDGSKFTVAIDRVVIENGTLTYSDAAGRREHRLEKVTLTLSGSSLQGPLAVAGSLTANGVPVSIDGKLGAKTPQGLPLDLQVKTADGDVKLAGTVSDLTPAARFAGTARLTAADLSAFARGLAVAAGMPGAELPPALARKVSFEGAIEASADTFTARDFKLALGDDQGSGTLTVALKPATRIDGKLSFTRLDLDKWLAAANAPPASSQAPSIPATPPQIAGRPAPTPGSPPGDVAIKLVLDAAEIIYNGGSVRKVVADASLENGQLAVRRLEALLPGNTQLAGSMTARADKSYGGDVTLAGPKLRETLTWLKVDVAQVPAEKLTAFSFKGRLQSAPGGALSISDATVQLDGMTARGNVTVGLVPLRVTADFQADTIDVDAYMPRKAAGASPAGKPPSGTPAEKPAAGAPAGKPAASPGATAVVDARIKAKVGTIVYNSERIEKVDADVTYRDGRLTFGDTRIGSVAGAVVSLKGSVANLTTIPRFDLAVGVQTGDADRLLKLAGVASPVKGPIGAVSLQGGVAGTQADLAFRDFTVSALGASLKMTGKLMPAAGNLRYDLSAFSFQTNDLDKVLTAFGNDKAGDNIGGVTASGAIKGDVKNVAFNGSFLAKGVQGNGTITAAFGGPVPRIVANVKTTSELNIDHLTGSGGGQQGAGGGQGGGRHSKAPINLAFMKSVDADVDITAPAISKAPWRLENASLRATLKSGVLTIARLAGGIYGGTVEIAGTASSLNATFDARLNATNVNLGTAARALGDSKRVDGVITTNLALRGSLASTADMVASLNGDGKVGGSVRFNASASEQVGGQIAGSALKGLGKRLDKMTGGSGIGDELGDMRAALKVANERFANRNGALSGTITIRNGQLHTEDLRVNGHRAWAITEADINLAAWTMVATTNIYIEENSSAPYVIVRQKGPVDHPNRSVDRGPAAAGAGRQDGQQPGQQQGQQPEGQPQQQQPDQQQQKKNDPLRKLRKIF